jgi:Fe-Mn family superoxide dismutase
MYTHHVLHHGGFLNDYNRIMEEFCEATAQGDYPTVQRLHKDIQFYGGVHVNHSLWWEMLANPSREGGNLPDANSALTQAINKEFGSFDQFFNDFNATAVEVQGSGWGWLAMDPDTKRLSLQTSNDQRTMVQEGLVPILGIDVWEHAYYLDYLNKRNTYLERIWEAVNWNVIEQRFENASQN